MAACKCGCGNDVGSKSDFVDRSHRKTYLLAEEEKLWTAGADDNPSLSPNPAMRGEGIFSTVSSLILFAATVLAGIVLFAGFIYVVTRIVKWSWQQ